MRPSRIVAYNRVPWSLQFRKDHRQENDRGCQLMTLIGILCRQHFQHQIILTDKTGGHIFVHALGQGQVAQSNGYRMPVRIANGQSLHR